MSDQEQALRRGRRSLAGGAGATPTRPSSRGSARSCCATAASLTPPAWRSTSRRGGYQALARALAEFTPAAGDRRGGSLGPARAGRRRLPHRPQVADRARRAGRVKYLICNGDEGDPGAYMDRTVLESDPHSVIEGMIIGAYAVGASRATPTSGTSTRWPWSASQPPSARPRRTACWAKYRRLRLQLLHPARARRGRVRLRRGDRAAGLHRGRRWASRGPSPPTRPKLGCGGGRPSSTTSRPGPPSR